jgi:hypothetical protein
MFHIPEFKITNEEEALAALEQHPLAFLSIPKKFNTMKVCLEAVKKNSLALSYMPKKLKTVELCLEAVRQDGSALQWVPSKLKTQELCFEAVKSCGQEFRLGEVLKYVPEKFKTEELCLEAVKRNGYELEHVPEKLKTASPNEFGAICLEAVKQNQWAIERVPEDLKTKEIMENVTIRKLTEEEKQKIIFVIKDLLSEDIPEEPTEYDVLMKQKLEEFTAIYLKDDEPSQIEERLEIFDKYIKGETLYRLGLIVAYDMWINESHVWPIGPNPE